MSEKSHCTIFLTVYHRVSRQIDKEIEFQQSSFFTCILRFTAAIDTKRMIPPLSQRVKNEAIYKMAFKTTYVNHQQE